MNTHQQLRANLWCNVATGIAVLPTMNDKSVPGGWADHILEDFDKRFPEEGPVDTDPKFAALREERDALLANIHNLQKAYDHVGDMLNEQRDITQKMYGELNELTLERDAFINNSSIDADVISGLRKDRDALRKERSILNAACGDLMRERDLYRDQLLAAGISPIPLP